MTRTKEPRKPRPLKIHLCRKATPDSPFHCAMCNSNVCGVIDDEVLTLDIEKVTCKQCRRFAKGLTP